MKHNQPEKVLEGIANLQEIFGKASDVTEAQRRMMKSAEESELTISEEAFLTAMDRGDIGLTGFNSPELNRQENQPAVIYPRILQDL